MTTGLSFKFNSPPAWKTAGPRPCAAQRPHRNRQENRVPSPRAAPAAGRTPELPSPVGGPFPGCGAERLWRRGGHPQPVGRSPAFRCRTSTSRHLALDPGHRIGDSELGNMGPRLTAELRTCIAGCRADSCSTVPILPVWGRDCVPTARPMARSSARLRRDTPTTPLSLGRRCCDAAWGWRAHRRLCPSSLGPQASSSVVSSASPHYGVR